MYLLIKIVKYIKKKPKTNINIKCVLICRCYTRPSPTPTQPNTQTLLSNKTIPTTPNLKDNPREVVISSGF